MESRTDILNYVEKHLDMLCQSAEKYIPFLSSAFPYTKNISESYFSMIAGSALMVFLNQYALRMTYPKGEDFKEFGKIISKYRLEIDDMFK